MNDWSTGWPAPAKLNLMLRVTGRRPDGYHTLQTVFQFVGLVDELAFRPRPDGRIERVEVLQDVRSEEDLTLRAARLLQRATGVTQGVDIRLRKRIPMGGGLGGGSSDAATTLVALDRLWGCGLGEERLAELGLTLGADVPVFVRGRAAWAEGVGECIEPIELDQPWYLVIAPACHVSTAAVFAAPELTRDSSAITIRAFVAGDHRNDCLPVVRERYPEVAQALEWLGKYSEARLTGTGACVFAEFADKQAAQAVQARLPDGWRGWVVRGMNRSPLLARLGREG
ncbi:MAG: 4-(cytidine 5'-diphospho)-2-C-methyl-D-erythritol kinase [Gammaproteobacteria bacterium]|nr:MAG: 4-(cytidine 5'-diphospho)-2-C-methyl-D-erythritol kinase [Gammaproteobacteria bacterium]